MPSASPIVRRFRRGFRHALLGCAAAACLGRAWADSSPFLPAGAGLSAAAYPSARILPEVYEALDDPTIDLVVVGTPNDTHYDLAVKALNAGKHVVVDKPFALTPVDAQRLAALALAKGRVLSVFQNRRWDSDFLGARAAIAGVSPSLTKCVTRTLE